MKRQENGNGLLIIAIILTLILLGSIIGFCVGKNKDEKNEKNEKFTDCAKQWKVILKNIITNDKIREGIKRVNGIASENVDSCDQVERFEVILAPVMTTVQKIVECVNKQVKVHDQFAKDKKQLDLQFATRVLHYTQSYIMRRMCGEQPYGSELGNQPFDLVVGEPLMSYCKEIALLQEGISLVVVHRE